MDNVDQKLERCLRVHLRRLPPEQVLDPDGDLLKLGLDSMSSIDLLMDLEREFGVTFPDHMLSREIFQNVRSLGGALRSLGGA